MTASETDRTEHAEDASVAWRVFAVLWAISLLYDGAVRTMTHDPHQLLVKRAGHVVNATRGRRRCRAHPTGMRAVA